MMIIKTLNNILLLKQQSFIKYINNKYNIDVYRKLIKSLLKLLKRKIKMFKVQ
jgi:hypothetical protein